MKGFFGILNLNNANFKEVCIGVELIDIIGSGGYSEDCNLIFTGISCSGSLESAPISGLDGGVGGWNDPFGGDPGSVGSSGSCPPGYTQGTFGGCVRQCNLGFEDFGEGVCVRVDCDTKKEDLQSAFPNGNSINLDKLAQVLNEFGKDFGIDSGSDFVMNFA